MSGGIIWDDETPPEGGVVWDHQQATHPVAGPSGNMSQDFLRQIGTGATNALAGTLAFPHTAASGLDWLAGLGKNSDGMIGTGLRAVGAPLRMVQPEAGFAPALNSIKAPGTNDPLFPSGEQALQGAYKTTGATEYRPETLAGRRWLDALSAAPMAIANPSSLPAMMVGGATGGQAAEIAPDGWKVPAAIAGFLPGARLGAGLANTALGVAGAPVPIGRPVSPTAAELGRSARDDFGIPIRGAQVEGRTSPVRYVDSELNNVPLSGMRTSNENIQNAYNRAVGNTFGEPAAQLSTDVFKSAADRLGAGFDRVTPQLRANLDMDLIRGLGDANSSVTRLLGQEGAAPITRMVHTILDHATQNGGTIPGDVYHSLVKRGGDLDRLARTGAGGNPDIKVAAGEIRDALNQSVERSLPAGSPALEEFRQLRGQWRSMRTAESAVDARGNISGAKLNQAANSNTANYKHGEGGDIAQLGRIGSGLMLEPPQSGTAPRSMFWKTLSGGGAAVGAAPWAIANPEIAASALAPFALGVAGVGGSAALARGASSYLRSPSYANRIIETGLNPDAFRFLPPDLAQSLLAATAGQKRGAFPANTSNSQ